MDKKRCNIGVITVYTENFYFGSLLKGIQSIIKQEEGRLFIFNTYMLDKFRMDAKDDEDYYSFSVNHIDGWIILTLSLKEEYANKILNTGKPFVFVGHRSKYYNNTSVRDDSYNGGKQITEHLLAHGHKRIAYIGAGIVYDMVERHAGYKKILEGHGFYDEGIVYNVASPMPEYGKEVAAKMIKRGIDFSAIFAANDYLAMGVIEGLKEGNINVPEDIAVIGYDNSDSGKMYIPTLSSMNQNTFEIGREAGRAVIGRIKGENVGKEILVKSELIIRESCGCKYKGNSAEDYITTEIMEKKSSMVERLEEVLYKNSDLGTKLFELNISDIINLIPQITDEYTWFCFGLFKDGKESKYKIVTQTVVDNIRKINEDKKIECDLENFPPLECMPDYELGKNDVILVVPISTEKKNIGIMAYVTKIHEETTLFVHDIHMLMYNLLGIAIDRNLVMTDLKETLESLKKTQEQLIESEKLVSLGRLVSGIAHEINKPIGEGAAATEYLKKNVLKLKELFDTNKLTKPELAEMLKENDELVKTLFANLQKASDLIKRFKQIAVDNTIDETRVFNVKECINDVILSIDVKSRNHNITINVECPEELYLMCNPGDLYRVFTNLILNSITHGYDEGNKGEISIAFEKQEKSLVLEYKDDGRGIESETFGKIFEPFFTTKNNNDGLGLGLYTVNNIIKQKFRGTIECESEYNKGTSFKIYLPLSLIANE
ncbi:substrate-binding domain-containing protein [Pseudobacteroides cellulosolvens]|uniref:histidine kinase n=1 Tax=Pseudobacteroides cellulosolvens ATCC 35603 = DSM 2933 TaxID=398512 RepID=A0A0L6JX38_9FIRM|nr:substrate-binding domain-containing protein [Pseudobacteroides cellulosolvens]KNY30007.1 ATP-binding region ATPase domain protein [Pseudobacteroides cellulosolvens ATCC 35603 = DSM 2933]